VTAGLYDGIAEPPAPLPVPARALAIGAHPDDIEFGAGGTLAGWASQGCEVTMLIVTDGSKGSWDGMTDQTLLVARRKDEQLAAARTLGVAHVVHLDHVDGELQYSMELRAQLCQQIRLARPDVLLSHDPWQRYQLHPDHRVTGLAAVDGMVAAREALAFREQGLPPHRPSAMLLWSADQPDHWEDVGGSLETKIEALLCHVSQGTTTMGGADQGEEERAAFVERIRGWAAEQGAGSGLAAAEAFKRLTP
jgi:LmbE family N-acetylglucosaminyl deacetylase